MKGTEIVAGNVHRFIMTNDRNPQRVKQLMRQLLGADRIHTIENDNLDVARSVANTIAELCFAEDDLALVFLEEGQFQRIVAHKHLVVLGWIPNRPGVSVCFFTQEHDIHQAPILCLRLATMIGSARRWVRSIEESAS